MKLLFPLLSFFAVVTMLHGMDTISLDHPVGKSITPDILYYSFDEGIVIQNEATAGGHDGGARQGSFQPPEATEGRFAGAIRLFGDMKEEGSTRNSYVEVTEGESLNFDELTGFTMGIWLRLDKELTPVEEQRIILFDKGGAGYNGQGSGGFSFYLQQAEAEEGRWEMVFETRSGQRGCIAKTIPVALPLAEGQWHHAGVSFDHENQTVTFWFDGEQVDPLPDVRNDSFEIASTERGAVIGERQTSGYWSVFRGDLDDFFITSGIYQFAPPQTKISRVP